MYKVSFFIVADNDLQIIKTFKDSCLSNVLVYLGDHSFSLKRCGMAFRVVVERIREDKSSIVFSFKSTDL